MSRLPTCHTRQFRLTSGLALVFLCIAPLRAAEQTLSQKVYDQLLQAQELTEQRQNQQALSQLQTLSQDPELSPYEVALVQQALGHVHASLEQYGQAADVFQQSLASQALPPERAQTVRYNLAQILIAAQRYEEGARFLELWLAEEAQPKPQARASLAQVYSQLKRYADAEQNIQQAIRQAGTFHEEWHQLLLFVYVEQQQWSQAAAVLNQLLHRQPRKKTYWLQLSQMYIEAGQQGRAASALALAHKLGLLEEQEVLYVVQSYLHLGLPYKAGDILHTGLATQTVADTPAHQELLVTCWLYAKEYQRALDVLERSAQRAESGRLDIRRAELLAQLERWSDAALAADLGIKKGGLEDTGHAYILLGIAQYRSGNLAASKDTFTSATSHKRVARQAGQWLRIINQQERQDLERSAESPPSPIA